MSFIIVKTTGKGIIRKLVKDIKMYRVGTYTEDKVFGRVLVVKKWSTKK